MTDEPTTPAADVCAYCAASRLDCAVADGCCEACESTGGCTHEPPPAPALDLAKLTLRCGDLRAQRDEARGWLADAQEEAHGAALEAEQLRADCGSLAEHNARVRANVEAAIAPWPPGVRKGDVYRALGGGA